MQLTVLIAGAGGVLGAMNIAGAAGLLATLGLSPLLARRLCQMAAGPAAPGIPYAPGPVARSEQAQADAWLAIYLVHAADRLAEASEETDGLLKAWENEERYFQLHKRAEERRLRSALHIDVTAATLSDRSKGLLGWYGILDERTTPTCRWAIGRNFEADKMPSVGIPGAVHIACRCTPGPPRPGAPLIPPA